MQRVARGFVAEQRPSVFGRKDEVNVNGGKGLWHERKMAARMLFANPNVTHEANQCAIPIRHAKRNPFSISTGLRPPAQRWRATPTLGEHGKSGTTPTGLWPTSRERTKRKGRNRVAVGNFLRTLTQGSSCLATLGFGSESRWDSRMARKRGTNRASDSGADNPKGIVASSPRLAQRLPWVNIANREQPQRGCGRLCANDKIGMVATALRLGMFCGR